MLLVIYRKLGGQKLSVDIKLGKQLFSKSKYYIVPGLMVAVFSQTDKIMLNNMLGQTVTGYYSAAVAIATIPAFVYSAIIDSYRPVIFANQGNQEQFNQSLRHLYSIVVYVSFAQSIIMTVFAELIVGILYGSEFFEAANALRIVVWFVAFSYFGSIRNIWMLAKEKQKYLWIINACGAALNVALNMLLIPISGITGASIASLITQVFSNFVLGFIIAPLRENNKLILSSLNPKHLLSLLKKT
jgi:O-antigen/teichoic acid export membrane protein